MQADAKAVDVHRIITTSFNVQLNRFIANYEAKRGRFQTILDYGVTSYVRTGQPSTNTNTFLTHYAETLKNFREEIFKKSVNWNFPIDSFISEFDRLTKFYLDVSEDIYNSGVLYCQLVRPLRDFLLSLDMEFDTNHFYNQIANKNPIINQPTVCLGNCSSCNFLELRVVNEKNKGVKKRKILISELYKGDSRWKFVIYLIKTDKKGLAKIKLPEGVYQAENEKYHLTESCQLNDNCRILFKEPKKKHWWQKG